MRRITDAAKVQSMVENYGVRKYFDTPGLSFQAFLYEKGELLTQQDQHTDWVQFVVMGRVRIYGIRDDGELTKVGDGPAPVLIGDLEFSTREASPFFTEAQTDVLCLAVSTAAYGEELNKDVTFLHLLLRSYAAKIRIFSSVDLPAQSLEERVLLYLSRVCPGGELQGTEKAAVSLHCSRRQLQRVLKKLCEEGKIEKTGRGSYRLKETDKGDLLWVKK